MNDTSGKEQNKSKRNVSEEWIQDHVLIHLEETENLQMLSFNAFSNIMDQLREYPLILQQPDWEAKLQLANAGRLITRFEILIPNIRKIIPVEAYNKFLEEIKFLRYLYDGNDKVKISEKKFSELNKKEWTALTPGFSFMIMKLAKLRENIVLELSQILYALRLERKGNVER